MYKEYYHINKECHILYIFQKCRFENLINSIIILHSNLFKDTFFFNNTI